MSYILYVEDNPSDVDITLTMLKRHTYGLEIVALRDGADALEYLHFRGKYRLRRTENPSLILLNDRMPRIDGRGVLRDIKADPDLKGIPAIVMTSSSTPEEGAFAELSELGVAAVLHKPILLEELRRTIDNLGISLRIHLVGSWVPPPLPYGPEGRRTTGKRSETGKAQLGWQGG